MSRIAVVGAGGFVGARLIEMAELGDGTVDGWTPVPVIRQYRSLGKLSRFGLREYRMADAANPASLREAFAGCEAVVNLTMGDNARIEPDTRNLYEACAAAGVTTFVHVSSAEVFGRCDTPGLTDDSPWQRDHWMDYARAKGRAEDWLRSRPSAAGPAVVTLRPGLVWGPRSGWVAGPAQALVEGRAVLFDGGRGACNLCYVDNLVLAITAAARACASSAGFYNVGDPDRPSWRDYYHALAQETGVAETSIADLPSAGFRESWFARLSALKQSAPARALKRRLRSSTRLHIKLKMDALGTMLARPSGEWRPAPDASKGMWWLQTTRYLLSTQKFDETFAVTRRYAFAEAMARTGAWLRFAGFQAGPTPPS